MRAQLLLHVGPDRVRALGEKVGALIDDVVEDLVAEMAHPDLVQIGERQAHAAGHLVPCLARFSLLAAQVLGGLLHSVDEGRVGVFSHGACLGDRPSLGAKL